MIAVVLAGGIGTRFWPLSRRDRPKQFLALDGERSMLERTVERLRDADVCAHVLVVAAPEHLDRVRDHLPDAPDLGVLAQPSVRETAPAAILAAVEARRRFGNQLVGLFPSDHVVERRASFHRRLEDAATLARDGRMIIFGIEPTRPETGYGYIRRGKASIAPEDGRSLEGHAHRVEAFVEKPDRSTARDYLASGDYLWNAGISIFRPSTLFDELERQMPESHRHVEALGEGLERDDSEAVAEAYESLEATSIDRGILEGARHCAVLPVDVGWSDVGHWAALDGVLPADADGNVVDADAITLDTSESVVVSEGTDRPVVGVDLEGLVVVDTPDAVLIVPKERAQQVRDLVETLEAEGRDDLL